MTIAPPPKSAPPKPASAKPPGAPKTIAAPPKMISASARPAKTFSVEDFGGKGEGEKIVIYGESGQGKTTLASMAPDPVFIGIDDGARKIRDPRTGAVLRAITGVESFWDVRSAISQAGLLTRGQTLVLDTVTKLESLSEEFMFETYKDDKGQKVNSIEGYGYGKGYRYALEAMRLFLQDCDALVRRGVNVVLLAQESAATMPNAAGLDYLQAGPKLHHTKQYSSRLEVCEWADHVLRVGYQDTQVAAVGGVRAAANATKGKLVSTDTTRVIFARAARHYFAKSRTLQEPVISFEDPSDDSIWKFIFPTETK